VALGMQVVSSSVLTTTVFYCIVFSTMPIAGGMLKVAVAHAVDLLEGSTISLLVCPHRVQHLHNLLTAKNLVLENY
jgi:hypothetical protein